MKKIEIIQKESEFTEIINNCPYKKNNYFVIYYRKNNLGFNKYGITIPTKTGKANVRNKIKRRTKYIIDINKKTVQSSYDYVIITRKRLVDISFEKMEKELISLIMRIGVEDEKK